MQKTNLSMLSRVQKFVVPSLFPNSVTQPLQLLFSGSEQGTYVILLDLFIYYKKILVLNHELVQTEYLKFKYYFRDTLPGLIYLVFSNKVYRHTYLRATVYDAPGKFAWRYKSQRHTSNKPPNLACQCIAILEVLNQNSHVPVIALALATL